MCLLEEAHAGPGLPAGGDVYPGGVLRRHAWGRYINLYYGSFAALAQQEDWDRATWEEELRTTLSHELTHHMEGLSGLHALDDWDAAELAQWRQELNATDEK